MGDLTFGKSFNGLTLQKTHWATASINKTNKSITRLSPASWVLHLLSRLPKSLNPQTKLLRFSEESVEARRRNPPPEEDIMSHLLGADPFFADPKRDYDLMTGDARLLIIAGSETTATALTFLVYHLAQDPSLQQTLLEELHANNIKVSLPANLCRSEDSSRGLR